LFLEIKTQNGQDEIRYSLIPLLQALLSNHIGTNQ